MVTVVKVLEVAKVVVEVTKVVVEVVEVVKVPTFLKELDRRLTNNNNL